MDESPDGTPVNLNFRHALTRVSAMLSSSNPAITVHVHYVKLYNIYHQGTFNFPQATTSPEQPGNVGSWSDLTLNSDQLIFYRVAYFPFGNTGGGDGEEQASGRTILNELCRRGGGIRPYFGAGCGVEQFAINFDSGINI